LSVRTRLAAPPQVPVAKVWGHSVPPAIEASQAAQNMTMNSPFSPGEPITPYDGYSRQPRTRDFATGFNIAARPRLHERVSFDVLKGLIDAYDIAQIAIWHRIDSLRSVKYRLVPADGFTGDVSGAVAVATEVLRSPDRRRGFKSWFGAWMYDVLAYDAGSLYRLRNRAGKVIGLLPVSGTSIAPLVDYWGNPPEDSAPAYVQYVQGLVWDWLTRDDLIYEPFRAVNDSIYGRAPIESIILNSNTDLRFQVHFLERFTSGNIPEAFASAPENWTPDQIENWQEYWDSIMYGDQSRKHQIRWMPGGSAISWTNEKDFTDQFSLFLMRKTCSAFHLVPTDLGFTDSANYSTGESQADVVHKVGELPLMEYVEDILSRFLVDDLGLPLKFEFDRGEDQDDRLTQAQADQTYINAAVVSADEVREMRFGLPTDASNPVPRVFFTERGGPIPLNAVLGVAGRNDPETMSPSTGAPLPQMVFPGTPGVMDATVLQAPLAVDEYGDRALPPAPPMQPEPPGQEPVGKEAAAGDGGGPTTGIASDTGVYGYDGPGERPRDDEDDEDEAVAKELAAFRKFTRARRKAGQWRDFRFEHAGEAMARHLNAEGRASIRKNGTPGLSPRSGMISLDLPDGTITPVPGGLTDHHVTVVYLGPDVDDEAFAAACDRAQQAAAAVDGPLQATVSGIGAFPPSDSSDGQVPAWAAITIPGAEDLRDTLEDLSASEHPGWVPHVTLAYVDQGDPLPDPLPETPVTFTYLSVHRGDQVVRYLLGGASPDSSEAVEKADPKAQAPDGAGQQQPPPPPVQSAWPGWDLDLDTAAYWVPLLAAAFAGAFSVGALVRAWMARTPASGASTKPERIKDLTAQADDWLEDRETGLGDAITDIMHGVLTDGYAIGSASADATAQAVQTGQQLGSIAADMGSWTPGASKVARELVGQARNGQGLRDLLDQAGVRIKSIADTRIHDLARVLAEGVENGDSAEDLTQAIEDMLSNPSRARMIVQTELARAANSAAQWAYRFHGIKTVRLITAEDDKVCFECDAEEAAGPRPLNEAPSPPLHPLCRCSLIPA